MKTFSASSDGGTRKGRGADAASMSSGVHADRPRHDPVRGTKGLQALVLVLVVGGMLTGCAFYGFSGASIPSHLSTIAIPIAENNTASPIPTLGRDLTNRLTDQFIGRTRYTLDNNEADADAVLTTRIREYTNRPTGVSGDERATTNSVKIRVQVRYYDQVRDSTMVAETFTGSAEYTPGAEEERRAAEVALDNVADDIFTTTTSDW